MTFPPKYVFLVWFVKQIKHVVNPQKYYDIPEFVPFSTCRPYKHTAQLVNPHQIQTGNVLVSRAECFWQTPAALSLLPLCWMIHVPSMNCHLETVSPWKFAQRQWKHVYCKTIDRAGWKNESVCFYFLSLVCVGVNQILNTILILICVVAHEI